MNYKTLIQAIGIDTLKKVTAETIASHNHSPYSNSRAYSAGIECGMTVLLKCIEQAGYSINKRNHIKYNVKKNYFNRATVRKSCRMRKHNKKG